VLGGESGVQRRIDRGKRAVHTALLPITKCKIREITAKINSR
jgi:hypothetical protein